jgi:glutamine cyclotransferase
MEIAGRRYDLTNLQDFKDFAFIEIDKRTQDEIFEGFVFDEKRFSMSVNAQINWSNLMNVPQEYFPVNVSTIDNELYLLSWENKVPFYMTALGWKSAALQEGTVIKSQIKACTTIQEIEEIINNL